MINEILGILLAFGVGLLCRFTRIPVPAPPTVSGALLVTAMTFGYVITDQILLG